MEKIKGKSFFLGENVDTDQILPGYAMSCPAEELYKHALGGSEIADFCDKVNTGDIIIAGDNFGCGSSREQAPFALKGTGLGAIVAGSIARIFRRNAINIGLPVLISNEIEKIKSESKEGDVFEIDLEKASLINCNTGKKYELVKLSQTTFDTLKAGGLINKVRNILISRGEAIEQ
jgi:3-isopropylmalate dehydratase small subunit